jgi:hypothetical protein
MGTRILVITVVIAAVFATYCVVTRANHKKLVGLAQIGAFAAFVFFTLVSAIEWGSRWYGLAALLLVWAVLGAWRLSGERAEQQEYTVRHSVANAIVMPLLVALTPALIFPQHAALAMTGAYQVATVYDTYTDARHLAPFTATGERREVNVECW